MILQVVGLREETNCMLLSSMGVCLPWFVHCMSGAGNGNGWMLYVIQERSVYYN